MNNNFLWQLSKTGNLDADLILRQYKLDLTVRFMEIKTTNPRLKQDEIAKQLGCSRSILLRYRQELIIFSPNRNSLNRRKKRQKIPDSDAVKKRQLTPKHNPTIADSIKTQSTKKSTERKKNKFNLEGGGPNKDAFNA